MAVSLPDISDRLDANGHLMVDFLLPSGIMVPLNVDFYASLDLIKKVKILKYGGSPCMVSLFCSQAIHSCEHP